LSSDELSIDQGRLAAVLGNAVTYVANEALVLAQYEVFQSDKFARLWASDDNDAFDKRMNRVEEHLGGPPAVYVLRHGEKPPPADNYPSAALRETLEVFHRARKSVLRAHLFMTGSALLKEKPELVDLPDDADIAAMFVRQAQAAFWEHAEAAYIRLYSFWDRVGQVLDFAFFNIRKFDQNGFYAVMDRIAANVVPMNASLAKSTSWHRLRTFQVSEKEDGLKWLLLRRNLVVHSLHLHPVQDEDAQVFESQFNHLDTAHREKLRPRSAPGEVALLMTQLARAGDLFSDALRLLELSRKRG
jgi:hypothetical protein